MADWITLDMSPSQRKYDSWSIHYILTCKIGTFISVDVHFDTM